MKEFKKPEVEIIKLVDEVIVTSSGCPTDCHPDCVILCSPVCQVVNE